MTQEILLSNVNSILKKYDALNQKTGRYFNIFEITNIATDEVKICRVIYELINPKGKHFQTEAYLKLFFRDVLKLDEFNENDYKNAKVSREKLIKDDRRIDLYIKIADKHIPIEVKIDAKDQKLQCYDYYKNDARNSNVFYLTKYGNNPSKESLGELDIKKVTSISFENEILIWLENCLKLIETIKIPPIREIIIQLISTIRKFTGKIEEDAEVEITKLLMKTPENMESAVEIGKLIDKCKTAKLKEIFKRIQTELDSELSSQLIDSDSDYETKCDNYYKNNGSTNPGISYSWRNININDTNIEFNFRVEVDHRIFFGICFKEEINNSIQFLSNDNTKQIIGDLIPNPEGKWFFWAYLPEGLEQNSPNFKELNKEFFELFDEKKFDEFIFKCIFKIKEDFKKLTTKE